MQRMRSLLFVPGNKANMLTKATGFEPDVLIPDMEDSVPDGEKDSARETVREWLPKLRAHPADIVPRVNSLDTGLTEADLAAIVGPDIAGISIGKVNSAEDINRISNLVGGLEVRAGLADGQLKLIPWIETAKAIVHCHEICQASTRIVAVAFGAEDFTFDMGIERLDDDSQLAYARSVLCTAARAAEIVALDTPYFQFRDQEGLHRNSIASKQVGFKGRFAIHPAQIETINACFSPSANDIAEAKRIVEAFEAAESAGRGSTSLDGRVIDVPVVKRARALLALAAAHSN